MNNPIFNEIVIDEKVSPAREPFDLNGGTLRFFYSLHSVHARTHARTHTRTHAVLG